MTSLILLGSVALVPVDAVLAGALVQVSLAGKPAVAGIAMTALTLASATPTRP